MFNESTCGACSLGERWALPARRARAGIGLAVKVTGVLILAAVIPARGQNPADKQYHSPTPARWTVLFRADDPSVWDTDAKGAKGEQIAIPLQFAPATFSYLRLRRMDTGEALILPLSPDELQNGKPPTPEAGCWWNGTSKEVWKGRHLGIVQAPRHKFPAPNGLIFVMNDGWDGFVGSGFGHKCAANDGQYYCWRGKEIRRTVFEIAVSDGPLSPKEERCLVPVSFPIHALARPKAPTLSPAAGPSKLTRENYAQIENGMTEQQVTEILGRPWASRLRTWNNGGRTKTLYWRQFEPYLSVTVDLRNDQVTGKNWVQSGPAQP